MTEIANRLTIGVKKLGGLPGAIAAWLQALDYTGFDYTHDHIEKLEREVAQLRSDVQKCVTSMKSLSE